MSIFDNISNFKVSEDTITYIKLKYGNTKSIYEFLDLLPDCVIDTAYDRINISVDIHKQLKLNKKDSIEFVLHTKHGREMRDTLTQALAEYHSLI